ncbi:hypothetical protein ACLK15_24740 [Escherichia coli]
MVSFAGWRKSGRSEMVRVGEHNMHNGLMAIAAARHVGVAPADAANALGSFINARRRLELRAKRMASRYMTILPITRRRFWQRWRRCVASWWSARIIAVLEPRSIP